LPAIALACAIVGSIYAGIATPTESSGIGFVLALAITFAMRRMTFASLRAAVEASLKTTVMILLIVAGAKLFTFAITLYLLPQQVSAFLAVSIRDPNLFVLAVGVMLLAMGCFLETLSMLLIMVPVLMASVRSMGIDPIWFGVFFVVLIELGLITPPVGMNLFVIQGVGKVRLEEVVRGAIPFAAIMLATAVLMWIWQDLVLYIPNY
jgi:C4-dicarboxylate transporter DctM subunit